MGTRASRSIVALTLWAVVAAIGSPAMAGETTWRAVIWGPKRASSQAFESFAQEVAAKTGGQMKIVFTWDQQGKPTEAADKLKSGAIEAGYFCAQYFGDKMPLTTVIDLPMFAPDHIPTLGRVELALADHPVIQAELKQWNIKMLLPVPLTQYQLMGTRRIAKVDDFQGSKVRISPEMGKALEEYGATAHSMPVPESLAAMKSGNLDLIALPMFAFTSYKIHETAKYMTEKISLGAPLCYLGVSQKAWDALPAKVQEVMLSLRQPTVAQYEAIFAREDAAAMETLKQKGIEFTSFSAADRARLVAKAIKFWQAWIEEREKQGLKAREVFEFVQAKIREFGRK